MEIKENKDKTYTIQHDEQEIVTLQNKEDAQKTITLIQEMDNIYAEQITGLQIEILIGNRIIEYYTSLMTNLLNDKLDMDTTYAMKSITELLESIMSEVSKVKEQKE